MSLRKRADRWFKGNLHAHTTNSDGDSSPSAVAGWYEANGYDFLALSDHDVFTDPATVAITDASTFLLIRAEELSPSGVHVNAFGLERTLPPLAGDAVREVIQRNVDAIRAGGAVPSINHPNYRWAIAPVDLIGLRHVRLLEVFNGEPTVNNLGDADHPSVEEVWDIVLRAGDRPFALAVDDAHHFARWGPEFANPGRGYVRVRAEQLSEVAILSALEAGDHYASTGVDLYGLGQDRDGTIRIEIIDRETATYTTTFIGPAGILDVQTGASARYRIGRESYVRARIDDGDGRSAWLQPVFADGA